MSEVDRIVRVRAATILHQLEVPIVFGTWIMRHREFFLVRVDARERPVRVRLRPDPGRAAARPSSTGPSLPSTSSRMWPTPRPRSTRRSGRTTRCTPRASACAPCPSWTCAAWDLAAKAKGQNITAYLGGERRRMPVTGIVGYPPSISPEETVDQIRGPLGPGLAALQAAHRAHAATSRSRACGRPARPIPDAWLGIDANFLHKTAADAIEFGKRLDGLDIGWFEDIVPPGDAQMVREIREGISHTRWPWATSRAAHTTRRRCSSSTPWTSTASTPPPTAASPGCGGILRQVKAHGNSITHAHVPAHPFAGPGRAGLHRRAHRVGHPVHRRASHGRPAHPAHRPRRPDGPAARPARLRHARGPGLDRARSTRSPTPTACSATCSRQVAERSARYELAGRGGGVTGAVRTKTDGADDRQELRPPPQPWRRGWRWRAGGAGHDLRDRGPRRDGTPRAPGTPRQRRRCR